jgi:hypothetical protein
VFRLAAAILHEKITYTHSDKTNIRIWSDSIRQWPFIASFKHQQNRSLRLNLPLKWIDLTALRFELSNVRELYRLDTDTASSRWFSSNVCWTIHTWYNYTLHTWCNYTLITSSLSCNFKTIASDCQTWNMETFKVFCFVWGEAGRGVWRCRAGLLYQGLMALYKLCSSLFRPRGSKKTKN